jgi:acyl-CoA reductase-like NAD-dependent aldehyde dehydrogenase
MTRITLELGGKSPVIVLDDCDPAMAAAGAANAIFFNHGQVCCAGSRLYVHKKMFDRVVADVADQASKLTLGHGLDPSAQMGPLVSQEQMERVCGYIDIGRSQGAEVLTGGARAGERGYFVQPTVMTGVQHDHRVAREEIFGPVLVSTATAPWTRACPSAATSSPAWAATWAARRWTPIWRPSRCSSTCDGVAARARAKTQLWRAEDSATDVQMQNQTILTIDHE